MERILLMVIALLVAGIIPAKAGQFEDGIAAYALGDYTAAFKLLVPLSAQGRADAQFLVGVMFDKGLGVSRDLGEAVLFLRRSAAQGNGDAQVHLGSMYVVGRGVVQDRTEAMRLFRLAAAQGHPAGRYGVGAFYSNGLGVPRNEVEAIKWFRLAARQGFPAAQFDLALAYQWGHGVERDEVRAHMWFSFAATTGDDNAAGRRDSLEKEMTPEQVAKAQQLARDCQRNNFSGCE